SRRSRARVPSRRGRPPALRRRSWRNPGLPAGRRRSGPRQASGSWSSPATSPTGRAWWRRASTAGHRRVLGGLDGVHVERGDVRATSTVTAALSAKDPLSLVGIAGVVEAAGEHVVAAETRARRVLVPSRPRDGPS